MQYLDDHREEALFKKQRLHQVTFSSLESHVDKIKLILGLVLSSLIQELQTNLKNFFHRVSVVLRDPSLSFPIHIPFQDHDDFNIDLVLNEMDRVLNSNEGFDISSTIRLNILSVSLPAIGGKDIGVINNRTISDLPSLMHQKRSVVRIIETDDNNCLITALAIDTNAAWKQPMELEKWKTFPV